MRVTLPRIGLNEGSLLRRTLLHVATFVLGTMTFIGIVSLVLVSVAKGLVAPRAEAAEEDVRAVASAGKAAPMAPVARPGRTLGKRPVTVPTPPPSKDD
jgi:hypothetical protein